MGDDDTGCVNHCLCKEIEIDFDIFFSDFSFLFLFLFLFLRLLPSLTKRQRALVSGGMYVINGMDQSKLWPTTSTPIMGLLGRPIQSKWVFRIYLQFRSS